MRKSPTGSEAQLHRILKSAGERLRRQVPVSLMIVDFILPKRNLIIEVDGGVHNDTKEKDLRRTKWLEGCGFNVLRFENSEILSGKTPEILAKVRAFRVSKDAATRYKIAVRCARKSTPPPLPLKPLAIPKKVLDPPEWGETFPCHLCGNPVNNTNECGRQGKRQFICCSCIHQEPGKEGTPL